VRWGEIEVIEHASDMVFGTLNVFSDMFAEGWTGVIRKTSVDDIAV
jgi:hypothetical protein